MKKFNQGLLLAATLLAFNSQTQAQSLPTYDLLGTVTNNTPNTWETYNFTFTPSTSGSNYIGFAFRQDPAYWSFDNVRLFAPSSTTNLITNGDMSDGGSISITTNNGPSTINAPTNWGVWYQNGTYPAAAGTWNGGLWYDGAVGTFDGIYQGVSLTAGTTYTILFDVSGNHTSNGNSVQLGVYGGVCADASIAADQCTMPSGSGFTTLATPQQGSQATSNPQPTTYSSVSTGNTVDTNQMSAGTFSGQGGTLRFVAQQTTVSNGISLSTGDLIIDYNGQIAELAGGASGTGSITIINNATGGSITLTGTYTYTGSTTIDAGATAINNADISSSSGVINLGTFTNNGVTSSVTNSGTFTNGSNGVTGAVTNSGTFTNNGTTGAVTNNAGGTFTNNGTTLGVTNSGTFTNGSNGVTGAVTNSGTFTNNGTTGDWTNSGTMSNSGTMGNGTNTSGATFTNGVSGTVGDVTNGGTFTNDGTTGNVSNIQDGAFTNNGTVGDITNSGVANNNGTAGAVTNLGNFNNAGTTGDWVNGFNGPDNTAVLDNTGNMGNGTNYSTFNNGVDGVVGNVNNVGEFSNDGTTGAVENTGMFTNNAGGTVSELSYNNYLVDNHGTITDITYNGGTVSNYLGGVIGSINNTEAYGTFNNSGTITGTVTTNSTFNNNSGGVVTGVFTNNGTMTNDGTVGNWINNLNWVNDGTAGDGTNNAYLINSGTVGDVENTGAMTNSGTAGAINNTGSLLMTGGTASVINSSQFVIMGGTLGSYQQTVSGTTTMTSGAPITVVNDAQLAGVLNINGAPTAYGRYTVLTAGSVSGTYGSFTSAGVNDYLKYSGSDVRLFVTPPAAETRASVDAVTAGLSNALNLQSSVVNGAVGSDCSVFGAHGVCVGFNLGVSKISTGDLYNSGLTLAKRISDRWRVGVVTSAMLNEPTLGGVNQKNDPAYGLFAAWSRDRWTVQGGAAFNDGTMTLTRNGPEVGVGEMSVSNKAYQFRVSYSIPATATVNVTPYLGLRHSESSYSGFTEQGPVFPLTVNAATRGVTSILAGVGVSKQLTEKLSGNFSVGALQNLSGQTVNFTGTSEIGGMSNFSSSTPTLGAVNPMIGLGVGYNIDNTTRVGVNVGWLARGNNADIGSFSFSFTKGF